MPNFYFICGLALRASSTALVKYKCGFNFTKVVFRSLSCLYVSYSQGRRVYKQTANPLACILFHLWSCPAGSSTALVKYKCGFNFTKALFRSLSCLYVSYSQGRRVYKQTANPLACILFTHTSGHGYDIAIDRSLNNTNARHCLAFVFTLFVVGVTGFEPMAS